MAMAYPLVAIELVNSPIFIAEYLGMSGIYIEKKMGGRN